jgi:flagellar hook-basal body complex protein FliE
VLSSVSQIPFSPGLGGTNSVTGPVAPSLTPTPTISTGVTEPLPTDFGAVLGQLASDAINTLKSSEATAVAGVRGQATTQQVVEAVLAAEQTLQAGIAVRDKVVSAYLEISRMSI